MKIKAHNIKPGMIIDRGDKDYELVTAKTGFSEVQYTHFDFRDGYHGKMIGFMKGKEKVKVITKKKKREFIIKSILKDVFERLHHTNEDVDLLRLVSSMDKGHKHEVP